VLFFLQNYHRIQREYVARQKAFTHKMRPGYIKGGGTAEAESGHGTGSSGSRSGGTATDGSGGAACLGGDGGVGTVGVPSSLPAKRRRHDAAVGAAAGERTAAECAAAAGDSGVFTGDACASAAAEGTSSDVLHTGSLPALTRGSAAAPVSTAAAGSAAAAEPHRKRPRGAWALKNDLLDPRTAAANAVRPGASVVVEKLVAAGCGGHFAQRPRPPPTDATRAGSGRSDAAGAAPASFADSAPLASASGGSGALPASAAPESTSRAPAGQAVRGPEMPGGGPEAGTGRAAGDADASAR
jgi:hypothetical protein